MLYNHFTEKLLNLQEVLIKKIENIENFTYIYLEMPMDTVILTDLEKEFYIYFHTKNEKNQTSKKR